MSETSVQGIQMMRWRGRRRSDLTEEPQVPDIRSASSFATGGVLRRNMIRLSVGTVFVTVVGFIIHLNVDV